MEKPNVIYIEELSEGDMEFKKKIISIIKKEFPLEVLEYRNSMKNNNFLNASEKVHKLKHKISILGLEKGYELATNFEKELKNKMYSKQVSFEGILSKISTYLNTI
jgi:hypothetical protein